MSRSRTPVIRTAGRPGRLARMMHPLLRANISTPWTMRLLVLLSRPNPSSPSMSIRRTNASRQICCANRLPGNGCRRQPVEQDRRGESYVQDARPQKPDWIAADTACGSLDNLVWLALKRQIFPFIPVFDKGERTDGIFLAIRFHMVGRERLLRLSSRQGNASHLAHLFRPRAECAELARAPVLGVEARLHGIR